MNVGRVPRPRQGSDLAVVYPSSGTDQPPSIGDPFAPRDLNGVYDLHRGCDMSGDTVVRAPVGGIVLRRYVGHARFRYAEQLADWTLVGATGGALAVVSEGAGPVRISGTGSHRWTFSERRIVNADWVYDIEFPDGAAWSGGQLVAGIRLSPDPAYHPGSLEFVQVRYDGTTLYCDAYSATATTRATTFAVAGARWLRVEYVSGVVRWRTATTEFCTDLTLRDSFASTYTGAGEGATWTMDLLGEVQPGASPAYVDVAYIGGSDDTAIPRFGNWVEITNGADTWAVFHLTHMYDRARTSPKVEAGEPLGLVGRTGHDFTSGTSGQVVRTDHYHSEVRPGVRFAYDSEESLNPLGRDPGRYPRAAAADLVDVVVTSENDPDAQPAWRVRQLSQRNADGTVPAVDFITYVGSLGTHVIDYNQRIGIDVDNPLFEDVYQVPEPFNSSSPVYENSLYHRISTYGAYRQVTFADTVGTVLGAHPFAPTAATVALRAGATPTNLFLHDQTSGPSTCAVTGLQLTASGATIGVATAFGGSDRAVQMSDGADHRVEAPAAGDFDPGAGSFAWLRIVLFGAVPAARRQCQVKASGAGYEHGYTTSGGIDVMVSDGVASATASLATSHAGGWHTVLHGVDRSTGLVHVRSDLGAATAAVGAVGSLQNAGIFAEGGTTAAAQTVTYTVYFVGVDAETVLQNGAAVVAAFHVAI